MQADLIAMSITAFISVFLLLALLAAVMQGIAAFAPASQEPETEQKPARRASSSSRQIDSAHVAAIHSAYQRLFPGKVVVHIEERS